MKAEIKKKWVDALRSGEYKQGSAALRKHDNSFCCLGVLCDLHSKETGTAWEHNNRYMGMNGTLSDDVIKWAGLDANVLLYKNNPRVTYCDNKRTLAELNDGRYADIGVVTKLDFNQIADLIDQQF